MSIESKEELQLLLDKAKLKLKEAKKKDLVDNQEVFLAEIEVRKYENLLGANKQVEDIDTTALINESLHGTQPHERKNLEGKTLEEAKREKAEANDRGEDDEGKKEGTQTGSGQTTKPTVTTTDTNPKTEVVTNTGQTITGTGTDSANKSADASAKADEKSANDKNDNKTK